MLAIDQGTKAYVAGILDIAGIIRLRRVKTGLVPYVGLSTTNKKVVDFLAGVTDTKVTVTHRKYGRHTCTEHCPSDCSQVDSTSYRWSVTGVKATVLLLNIRRYLIFKTTEVIEVLNEAEGTDYKPATYAKMRALGWEIPDQAETKKKEG